MNYNDKYKEKYLYYKLKYLKLRANLQIGGGKCSDFVLYKHISNGFSFVENYYLTYTCDNNDHVKVLLIVPNHHERLSIDASLINEISITFFNNGEFTVVKSGRTNNNGYIQFPSEINNKTLVFKLVSQMSEGQYILRKYIHDRTMDAQTKDPLFSNSTVTTYSPAQVDKELKRIAAERNRTQITTTSIPSVSTSSPRPPKIQLNNTSTTPNRIITNFNPSSSNV